MTGYEPVQDGMSGQYLFSLVMFSMYYSSSQATIVLRQRWWYVGTTSTSTWTTNDAFAAAHEGDVVAETDDV